VWHTADFGRSADSLTGVWSCAVFRGALCLRLRADELEAEVAQPVEELVELRTVGHAVHDGLPRAPLQ
jgi:hypothetical protein